MSFQVNEARNQWIRYLINFTEVWGKIIKAKKGKEAEQHCAKIINIIQKLKKLDPQWQLENSASEREQAPVQYNSKNNNHMLQGA